MKVFATLAWRTRKTGIAEVRETDVYSQIQDCCRRVTAVPRPRSIGILMGPGMLIAIASLAALVLAIYKRQDLMVWYATRGLCRARPQDRAGWIARLQPYRERSVASLLAQMRKDDPAVCEIVRLALLSLSESWGPEESSELINALEKAFPSSGMLGQQVVLELTALLLERMEQPLSDNVWIAAGRIFVLASHFQNGVVRSQLLDLVQQLLDRFKDFEASDAYREVIQCCLRDELPAVRIRAVRFAMRQGADLLNQVVPLLTDSEAEVRRAAILAVGPSSRTIETEELLPLLHDPDDGVRKLCADALRSRGLGEEHLKLGKLMTDGEPGSRLRIFDLLRQTNDLDTGLWLRRLSHDPEPAVRAGAARAAAEHRLISFSDRLVQMSQNDPSQTVRQLAQYYLSTQRTMDAASQTVR